MHIAVSWRWRQDEELWCWTRELTTFCNNTQLHENGYDDESLHQGSVRRELRAPSIGSRSILQALLWTWYAQLCMNDSALPRGDGIAEKWRPPPLRGVFEWHLGCQQKCSGAILHRRAHEQVHESGWMNSKNNSQSSSSVKILSDLIRTCSTEWRSQGYSWVVFSVANTPPWPVGLPGIIGTLRN